MNTSLLSMTLCFIAFYNARRCFCFYFWLTNLCKNIFVNICKPIQMQTPNWFPFWSDEKKSYKTFGRLYRTNIWYIRIRWHWQWAVSVTACFGSYIFQMWSVPDHCWHFDFSCLIHATFCLGVFFCRVRAQKHLFHNGTGARDIHETIEPERFRYFVELAEQKY